jgi:hypothetical protein
MQIADSLANLRQFPRSFRLPQFLVTLYHLVKRPFLHVLHQYVEIDGIMEKPIKLDHIWMREEEADLQFLNELLEHEAD